MKRTVLVLFVAASVASPAWAIRDFTPPWGWAGQSITTQGWESTINLNGPSYVDNHWGTPQMWGLGVSPGFDPNGPGYTGINVWHVGSEGGSLEFDIPNTREENPVKYIHLQYTSNKASTGAPGTIPAGSAQAGGVAGHAGTWYTYEWTLTIMPNPPSERISIPFPADTNIEEIWISTICTTPEPGVLMLLTVGSVAVIRRRRSG